ncbi:hypothetical protein Tco_1309166 [Tanacetum coccineum]
MRSNLRTLLHEIKIVHPSIQGRLEGPFNRVFRRKILVYWENSSEITIGDAPLTRKETLNFVIVKFDSPYNMLLGRTAMQKMGIVVSTIHRAIKFHTTEGIGTVFSTHESDKVKEGMKKVRETPPANEKGVYSRRKSGHVFAWTHADMTGIPRTIIVKGKPFNTKHTNPKKDQASAMVMKSDGGWRMCVDFTDINKACPKDCYPLPEIDWKVESLLGFRLKCFLDTYKGYHQIQMAEGYEDKTAFFAGERGLLLPKDAFWFKECQSNIPKISRQGLPRSNGEKP